MGRTETTDPLAKYTLCTRYNGARIAAGHAIIDELELEPDDDVRVYDLETTDNRDGILLVDADSDPRIATDGGHDIDSANQQDLEFSFEYTTIADRRRRVTIIPDTGGEAWRITYEYRDGDWRETGREPISGVAVQLSHQPADLDDESTSGQPALPDGGQSHTNTQSADDIESQIDHRRTAARSRSLRPPTNSSTGAQSQGFRPLKLLPGQRNFAPPKIPSRSRLTIQL